MEMKRTRWSRETTWHLFRDGFEEEIRLMTLLTSHQHGFSGHQCYAS